MGAGGGSLIVLSLLLLRKKKPYGTISHGVVEVSRADTAVGVAVSSELAPGLPASPPRPCALSPPLALLQVDPMLTLEEQQLRELQRHGYENPTYRFLEERP